jgi:DNA repair protein RadC
MDEIKKIKITDLSEDDRPREKMMKHGAASLSDAELLAILIGSGSREETAIDLCRRILQSVHNDLNALGRVEIKGLVEKFHGIGEAKAITILAALELGRRRKNTEIAVRDKITTSRDVFEKMQPKLADLSHEEFWIVLLY